MNTYAKIYAVVGKIPKGKVSTYGLVARSVGISNARVVGFALHANKNTKLVPCHRVINSKGLISSGYAFGGADIQRKLLEAEGIKFDDSNAVNFKKYGFSLS